jgi:hypothetical protein
MTRTATSLASPFPLHGKNKKKKKKKRTQKAKKVRKTKTNRVIKVSWLKRKM